MCFLKFHMSNFLLLLFIKLRCVTTVYMYYTTKYCFSPYNANFCINIKKRPPSNDRKDGISVYIVTPQAPQQSYKQSSLVGFSRHQQLVFRLPQPCE